MTTHTDNHLKQALAKMLPEQLCIQDTAYIPRYDAVLSNILWDLKEAREVLDTELLHICWLIKKTLSLQERVDFSNGLAKVCGTEREKIYASWEQETVALAKVKGIEI